MRTVRIVLSGVGNVGRRFLEMAGAKRDLLRARHGLDLRLVAAADSRSLAVDPDGLDMGALAERKRAGLPVSEEPGALLDVLHALEADAVLEASPTQLQDGGAALALVRRALVLGVPCVLASKGPLVLAFGELAALSRLSGPVSGAGKPALAFGGAVAGALPTVNLGRRDLAAAFVPRMEAILNCTTQVILGRMAEGLDYAAALAEAQHRGLAEPDPRLDVEGLDAACKLVILANAMLAQPTGLGDVELRGITDLDPAWIRAERAAGRRVSLLATAEHRGGRYALAVRPESLAPEHPFGRLGLDEMGIRFETDLYGTVTVLNAGQGPGGAAAAMLRDLIDLGEQGLV